MSMRPIDDIPDEGLRTELRRARFHEAHNFEHWQQAEARVAALLLEVEGISHHFASNRYSNPDVQVGCDLVCSRLDLLLTKESQPR